ncbi:MAG: hypothetical protein A2252_07270 [Elusimicrobia bacterium RIFOXYA2_FULL_39_19]|nr:MAG: hypothetical protein A2252_07270 [Elusimicrobia bacterium RIFOXYA2_FULL_39_19]
MINNSLHPLTLFFNAFFLNNLIFIQIIGLCSFFKITHNLKNAAHHGLIVIVNTFLATLMAWVIFYELLTPINAQYMQIIVFVFLAIFIAKIEELLLVKYSIRLYGLIGKNISIIMVNCAVVAAVFLSIDSRLSLVNTIIYSAGVAIGYYIAIILFAILREKVSIAPVPDSFKGIPIDFILAGLISITFIGFKSILGL